MQLTGQKIKCQSRSESLMETCCGLSNISMTLNFCLRWFRSVVVQHLHIDCWHDPFVWALESGPRHFHFR